MTILFLISIPLALVCWVWLLIRTFQTSGFLAGLLCFIFWPLNIVQVLQQRGDPQRDITRPYVATLVTFVAFYALWFRVAADLLKENEAIAATRSGLASLAGDDEFSDQIRYAQAMARIAFQRGEVSIPRAEAIIEVPAHFRFAARPSLQEVTVELGGNLPDDVAGWLVHDSVDLTRDGAWIITVSYDAIGHVGDSDPEDLADPKLAQATLDYTARNAADEYRFVSFAHPPTWRADHAALIWSENIAWADDSETVDCHAVKPARAGVLWFSVEDLERSRSELCLRAVRLMAAKTRFREGHAWNDYSFFSDKRSGHELVDLVSGAAYQ